MLDKRNSAFKTISICTIIAMLILTFSINVNGRALEELKEEANAYQEQVNNIVQSKEALSNLADLLRVYWFFNDGFTDSLSQKWLELDSLQNDITYKIDFLNYEIDEIIKQNSFGMWKTYKITAYCGCKKCCGKSDNITANGSYATQGVTIATGTEFKFGMKIEIDGYGIRTVQDRGVGNGCIDLYFDSHQDALNFGVKRLNIRTVN